MSKETKNGLKLGFGILQGSHFPHLNVKQSLLLIAASWMR